MESSEFVVIPGAQKSGTTSLYGALVRHPSCREPSIGARKEPHFFAHRDETVADHIEWYRDVMCPSGNGLSVDASTAYLASATAPERIAKYLSDARILIVLRDPAKRAFSAYKHQKQEGDSKEERNFDAILSQLEESGKGEIRKREDDILRAALAQGTVTPSPTLTWHYQHVRAPFDAHFDDPNWEYRYFGNSSYREAVGRFEALFDSVKVVFFEQMLQDPASVLREVFEFCGLNANGGEPVLQHKNPTRVPTRVGAAYTQIRKQMPGLASLLDQCRSVLKTSLKRGGLRHWITRLRSTFWGNPSLSEEQYERARALLKKEYVYWHERVPLTRRIWTY